MKIIGRANYHDWEGHMWYLVEHLTDITRLGDSSVQLRRSLSIQSDYELGDLNKYFPYNSGLVVDEVSWGELLEMKKKTENSYGF